MPQGVIKLKVFRFDPRSDEKPRYEVYEVQKVPDVVQSVTDLLEYVLENLDSSLAFYRACGVGLCGGCTVMINGRAGQPCTTIATDEVIVEPLKGYRIIKDLVIDMKARLCE